MQALATRSTARAAVMQMIYEKLSGGESGEETLQMVYDVLRDEGKPENRTIAGDEPGTEDRAYITRILEGVISHLDELDEEIGAAARGWTVARMPHIDLSIMRLAAYEILFEDSVPGPVAINEAVNLAATYSEPASGRFINGVLGTILRKHEAAK